MRLHGYGKMTRTHPGLGTDIVQRLGYDYLGRRLAIDGIAGPLTEGAIYVAPESVGPELVRVAMRELLKGAEEVGGNNRGERVERYQRGRAADLAPWMRGAWCASFVSWCLWRTFDDAYPYIRGARRLGLAVAERSELGEILEPGELEAGDLIIWDRDGPDAGDDPSDDWSGHIGIMVGRAGGYIWTIEGNAEARRGAVRVYRFPEGDLDRDKDEPFLFGARPQHG